MPALRAELYVNLALEEPAEGKQSSQLFTQKQDEPTESTKDSRVINKDVTLLGNIDDIDTPENETLFSWQKTEGNVLYRGFHEKGTLS